MRRAILIAAVALGSGCIVETTPNRGDAAVYWSFWSTAAHGGFGDETWTSREVCASAGVDVIEITLVDPRGDALPAVRDWCVTSNDVPGALFTSLETGTWQYVLDGYRGDVLVFSDYPSLADPNEFTIYDGSDTVVDTYPAALYGDLELRFNVPTCISTDTVEFDLYDSGSVDPVYSTWRGTTNPPIAVGCTTTPFVIPSVPAAGTGVSTGEYELAGLAQVDSTGADVHFPACIPNWTQSSGTNTIISVTIDSAAAPGPTTYCSHVP